MKRKRRKQFYTYAYSSPSSQTSLNRIGGLKLRSMYACLKGSISQEKTCWILNSTCSSSFKEREMRPRASRGDSVPEHIVATRRGRPSIFFAKVIRSGRRATISRNISGMEWMGGNSEARGDFS